MITHGASLLGMEALVVTAPVPPTVPDDRPVRCYVAYMDAGPLPIRRSANEELRVADALREGCNLLGVGLDPHAFYLRLAPPLGGVAAAPGSAWPGERLIRPALPAVSPSTFELCPRGDLTDERIEWDTEPFDGNQHLDHYERAPTDSDFALGNSNHESIDSGHKRTLWVWMDEHFAQEGGFNTGHMCPRLNHTGRGVKPTPWTCCAYINGQWLATNIYMRQKKPACCKEWARYRCTRGEVRGSWVQYVVQRKANAINVSVDVTDGLLDETVLLAANDDGVAEPFNVETDLARLPVLGGDKLFGPSAHRTLIQPNGQVTLYLWKNGIVENTLSGLRANGKICSDVVHDGSEAQNRFAVAFSDGDKWYQQTNAFATRHQNAKCCGKEWYLYKRKDESKKWIEIVVSRAVAYTEMATLRRAYDSPVFRIIQAEHYVVPLVTPLDGIKELTKTSEISEECLRKEHATVLVGEGRIGKTALCRELVTKWSSSGRLNTLLMYVPLSFRDWVPPQELLEKESVELSEWIGAYWKAKHFMKDVVVEELLEKLRDGHRNLKVLWIFDGLGDSDSVTPRGLLSTEHRAALGIRHVLFATTWASKRRHDGLGMLEGWHLRGLVSADQQAEFGLHVCGHRYESAWAWISSHGAQELCRSPEMMKHLYLAFTQSQDVPSEELPLRRTADVLAFVFRAVLRSQLPFTGQTDLAIAAYAIHEPPPDDLEATGLVRGTHPHGYAWSCEIVRVFFLAVAIAARLTKKTLAGWRHHFPVTQHARLWHLIGGLLVRREGCEWYATLFLDEASGGTTQ